MKKLSLFILALFIISAVNVSFAGEKWTELEAFHKVMSETFHPAEEGNYQPIKDRIGEMVGAASSMVTNPVPAEYNKPEIIDAAKKLETESKALEEKIKAGATDQAIFTDLNVLHDTFHTIVGLCNPKEEHKDEKK